MRGDLEIRTISCSADPMVIEIRIRIISHDYSLYSFNLFEWLSVSFHVSEWLSSTLFCYLYNFVSEYFNYLIRI